MEIAHFKFTGQNPKIGGQNSAPRRRAFLCGIFTAAALTLAAPPVYAASPSSTMTQPVVLELFTSQGCYSCPPAEKLLREAYSGRDDVVALEMHVDYWNDLVYGGGNWVDPFSRPAYTRRQRDYNLQIRGRRDVYTPQTIVQGAWQVVGSRRGSIDAAIQKAREAQAPLAKRHGGPFHFRFSGAAGEGFLMENDGDFQSLKELELVAAVFLKSASTEVTAGENSDKRLINTNVVTELVRHDGMQKLRLPPLNPATHGCAVWLQQPRTGMIVGAAKCPPQ